YFTLRRDFRKCASPLCGGFFVKRVNLAFTVCADGRRQKECYVAGLDLSALGLDPEQTAAIQGSPQEFLLRGKILPKNFPGFGNLGNFTAREAWRGHAGVTPTGSFFRAKNNGIVCITFPCLSFDAEKLNSLRRPVAVAGVDLDGIVPDPSDGIGQLNEREGLLVAAVFTTVSGPAGRARALDASEYYIPFRSTARLCGVRGLPSCSGNEFCDFPREAQCGAADQPGVCRPRPDFCTLEFNPVCGCDGKTYSNTCHAAMAGVSVAHRGQCERTCGTIAGLTCEKGEFCDFGLGQCKIADAAGVCRQQPEVCLDIFDPVCGCDGITYGNACEANRAGAQIDHVGACK
ncbi:MAG TPA: Kazal-type serine protease inhibitor family protein, partial [Fibrobacteria bacterium]|nr:Kazal-type serine protease inhibitor family protein [Fibrobacteria bacterium]